MKDMEMEGMEMEIEQAKLKEIEILMAKRNTRNEAMQDITTACHNVVVAIYRDGITHEGLNSALHQLSAIVDSYQDTLGYRNTVRVQLDCQRSVLDAYEFSCLLK